MTPKVTLMTDEDMIISPEMMDDDYTVQGQFRAGSSLGEGVSGCKPIDTMFENTDVDQVESPREGSTPAPRDLIPYMYPHRRI